MLIRTVVTLAAVVALGSSNGWADARKARRHHHGAYMARDASALSPPYYGGTLVLHPASNIACNTPYRATRALACDQPVWVYGSPCEIDLGLGRYRSCY